MGCFVLVVLLIPSGRPPSTLGWRLATLTRQTSFDLWSWEVRTLSARIDQSLRPPLAGAGPSAVRRYARLSVEENQARARRDGLWAREDVTGAAPGLARAQGRLDALDARLARLRPEVEAVLSAEVDAELRRRGLAPGLDWTPLSRFPFFLPDPVPGVYFQLGPLPDLLAVAPRDRIELIGSVLVQPNLAPAQIDALENGADRLGVSSVVVGIGGLAAYPSMVPDDGSVKDLVITVSHEWTHHYLALRPLGMAYFNSYQMREINETVADMVGHEVGRAVYQRYYASSEPKAIGLAAAPPPSRPAEPDFWTLMRRVRVRVEAYLARHDVAGADAYMARARRDLARRGYYVRRLNTAYLAFFGSYAQTANPFEPKLRALRARTGSLKRFLEVVSQVRSPADLDRLVGAAASCGMRCN